MNTHIHVTRRRLLTPKQAARLLNIQESALASLCERGLIAADAYEFGAPTRFIESEVNKLSATLRSSDDRSGSTTQRKARFALWG